MIAVVWRHKDFFRKYNEDDWYVCVSKVEDIIWREFVSAINNYRFVEWKDYEVFRDLYLKVKTRIRKWKK